ncbi:hypothetical protein NA57DRAFT_81695 [Rhizodiscina lignyota]|uniref:EthD domain-containing protein n=1 Tax=Rhizodiscina lignyota TaxID=1504668 RepID=A0A9P4I3I6_9PEZI|nr:hypothetical protein NA57DRAFT_81695 [Rhizodiscina lignyota]
METQREVLCLTILGFKRPGMKDEDYRNYMLNVHAPLVSGMMEKYGFRRWTMVRPKDETLKLAKEFQTHNTDQTRDLMKEIYDPQFANVARYDSCIQIVFPDIACFVRMKADPYFRSEVGPDHEKFADTKASQMTIGWFTEVLRDGKFVGGVEKRTAKAVDAVPADGNTQLYRSFCGEL